MIKSKLKTDPKFQQRCKLAIEQVITLLEFCLNTIYFIFVWEGVVVGWGWSTIRSKDPSWAH